MQNEKFFNFFSETATPTEREAALAEIHNYLTERGYPQIEPANLSRKATSAAAR